MELGPFMHKHPIWTWDFCVTDIILFISTFFSKLMVKGELIRFGNGFIYMKKRLTQFCLKVD